MITKFSGMGRLPHFLSYGAPPTRASRAGGAPLLKKNPMNNMYNVYHYLTAKKHVKVLIFAVEY